MLENQTIRSLCLTAESAFVVVTVGVGGGDGGGRAAIVVVTLYW